MSAGAKIKAGAAALAAIWKPASFSMKMVRYAGTWMGSVRRTASSAHTGAKRMTLKPR
jgi:hypothetical protein